jgi:hypothetical protein
VSNGIVKDHDGWIEVESPGVEGKGAVFRVYLPTGAAVTDGAAPGVPLASAFDTARGLRAVRPQADAALAAADPMGKD